MKGNLQTLLQEHFSYDSFQEGQEEIIRDVLQGKNVLGMLKTGSGKSICYQLPAKVLPHLTIVVSPLISLMIDQVREAKAFGFKEVAALHSMQTWEERQYILHHLHTYKLLYISPELIQQQSILNLCSRRKLSLFVIDEAHCISQWGHDFRPDYLRLHTVINALGDPPVLALTGTATPAVQDDIQRQLQLHHMARHLYKIDRENIALVLEKVVDDQEKLDMLVSLLKNYKVPTIIYFSSRKMTEQMAQTLQLHLEHRSIAYYHGGMDANDRLKVQQQFMHDQLQIICCTSAFGMGINKKNIRLVIHYQMPSNIEAFIQEIGRAGRDGEQSVSCVLYKDGDIHLPLQLIEQDLPTKNELLVINDILQPFIKQQEPLPQKDEEVEMLFRMKATKIRFLYYQLQTHGMMDSNMIVQKNIPPSIWVDMEAYIQKRILLKKEKAFELQSYMTYDKCLREELYRGFQQTISKVTNCCTNCGFQLSHWDVEQKNDSPVQPLNWMEQLRSLLLVKE